MWHVRNVTCRNVPCAQCDMRNAPCAQRAMRASLFVSGKLQCFRTQHALDLLQNVLFSLANALCFISQSALCVCKAYSFFLETMRNDEATTRHVFPVARYYYTKKTNLFVYFATQARRLAGTHNRMLF